MIRGSAGESVSSTGAALRHIPAGVRRSTESVVRTHNVPSGQPAIRRTFDCIGTGSTANVRLAVSR